MIPRLIHNSILENIRSSGKVVILFGARQVGKTTLAQDIEKQMKNEGSRVVYLNCDIEENISVINTTSKTVLTTLLSNVDVLIVDEAQRLDNPGLTLKIIYDNFKNVKVLATGSASFDLKNRMSDAMTGRYFDFTLYPFSFMEVLGKGETNQALFKAKADALLSQVMLYGLYPDVYQLNTPEQKQQALSRIVDSYLFKDILEFQKVKNSQIIRDLTKALAYQIGSEVSETELANRLKIDRKTILSYIDILEKTYVIVKVRPFSKNPRREIGKKNKIYFTDLGIRNSLIGDFNPINLRTDAGAMWENFLIIERLKGYANINQKLLNFNFWRSYAGAEVDYLEKRINHDIEAFEFKFGNGNLTKGTRSFTKEYNVPVKLFNTQNYLDFLQVN